LATGWAVSSPMRTGGGGTRPADAGQATASCSGGHPQATAVSAADTRRPDTNPPDTDLLDTDCGSGSASGQPRRPRCPVLQPPRHRPQCPAAGRTAADPQPPLRRDGRTAQVGFCSSALVKWPGRRSQRRTAVRMRGHRTGPPEHREPACPGTADTPRSPQGMGTLRQRPRWTAGSRTVHHPAAMSDRNGTPMCGTGQHARLTARSVGWGRPET
jgi:hypothetical protein